MANTILARSNAVEIKVWRCFVQVFLFELVLSSRQEFGSPRVITWDDLKIDEHTTDLESRKGGDGGILVISKDGNGDSTTVQGAVDMVPDGNKRRVKLLILPGIYREKVLIPSTKPYISFIGKDSTRTIISWNSKASDRGPNGKRTGTYDSASVAVESDYFCATRITFENSVANAKSGEDGKQAVALRVSGDKAVFLRCRFLGSQDTLFDNIGRHLFSRCYIRGSIDFIFGSARSLYKSCTIDADANTYGAVAASQRNSTTENSGFSFVSCNLKGKGMIYLGRAWGRYSRVIYANCRMDGIVMHQGWHDWDDSSRRSTVTFGEYNCSGAGANLEGRVAWAKSMTYEEARPFLGLDYIDGHRWLRF